MRAHVLMVRSHCNSILRAVLPLDLFGNLGIPHPPEIFACVMVANKGALANHRAGIFPKESEKFF
jgi:hypothetical protein